MGKNQEKVILSHEELSDLKTRIKESNLAQEDVSSILSMLQLIVSLKQLLEKRKLGLLIWLRRIFGVKTEKTSKKPLKSKITAPMMVSTEEMGVMTILEPIKLRLNIRLFLLAKTVQSVMKEN